jgi:hypothetical protein
MLDLQASSSSCRGQAAERIANSLAVVDPPVAPGPHARQREAWLRSHQAALFASLHDE